VIGLSSSSVPRDLLPDIQTEEDLQAIFEANSVSTDNTDTHTAISLTQLSSMTMVSVSNYIMVGSLLSVELCAVT
jgi:hypothetical protein